jgi:hypothetical protein
MSAPSPSPAPAPTPFQCDQNANHMFNWVAQNIFGSCKDPSNPICVAVVNAAKNGQSASLKDLASEISKISETDMVQYFQTAQGKVTANVLGLTILPYLKCYVGGRGDGSNKSAAKDEINAINRIKNFYTDKYLPALGKSSNAGNFSESDARAVRMNLDRMWCKDKNVYATIAMWSILSGLLGLLLGTLICKAKKH